MAVASPAHALTALAIGLAAVAFGCEPEAEGASATDGGVWPMELGKGELAFGPLVDGDALPYVPGPQGGQHVWVAFRMRDLTPERVLVQVTTVIEGHDELALDRRGRVNFELDDGGAAADAGTGTGTGTDAGQNGAAYVYAGWPAQILDATEHIGERAHIDVVLEDRAGRRAAAHAWIEIGEAE